MRIPSSAADRHRWDDGSACGLIPDRLDAIAASDPDRLAFLSSQEELTFAELEQQSCTVAAALVDWGVRPGQTIALLCRAAAAQVVASVGVLRAGAISVTLNPAHPLERLAWILSDSQATLLIHDQAHQALAARLAQQALPCRALPHLLDASSVSWSRPEITPDAGAFINYSSGSTGKPKGILHTHRSTLQLSLAAGCRNVAPGERVLLCGNSMAFNRTILQAATCCHWPLEALGLDGLQQWIRKSCPSIFLGTPSIFRLLVQLLGDSLVDLPLRRVLLTGEPLYRRELETFRSHLPADALIVNQLGSNESKTFAQFEIASSTVVDEDVVPVGLPLEGKLVRVVDATGTDCLVGQTGEIVVTAAGLPPGYWRRADLTRRAFEKCAGSNGLRSYRTGDRGRWRADGLLVHCGRSDWQCKVRGQKVERMEVEAALASLDGLDEVAVIDHQLDGDTQLVAYYTETSAGAPSPSVLRAQLISRLPAFMVPSRWVRLEAFPRTPTGKIARLALPLPAPLGSNGEVEDPPQTEAELQLAAVWVEVLALERVGRQDDFFMLGGHSLLAIEACERLRSRGWHLPVDRFYRAPTLAAAAAEAEPIAPKHPPEPSRPTLHTLSPAQLEAIAATVPGGAANIQDIYPLAPLQEGFLLQARLDPDHDALTVITVLSFATRADLDHYLTALRAVVDRHDILRTLFFWEGLPEPVQVVLRQVPLQDQPLSDGGGEGEACERLLLQRLPEAMGIRADQAPLLNTCSIFDGTAQRWLLRLQVHHLVTDHFSTHLMEREIRLYLAGRSDELPDPGSFRDVVAQARQGPGSAEHACFFRRLLAGISEPTIPFGLPLRRVGEEAPREARLLITAACTRRLRRTASSHGVTLATLCHLAWALVLARVTGRDDVVFGTVLLGRLRGDAATRRVMGPCINTLPVRVRLSDLSVGEACLAMQQLLAELLHHEQASLAEAQAASGVSGQGGLFSAVLNYRHQHWGSLLSKPKGDLGRPQQLLRRAFSSYPLVLSIDDGGSELSLKVQVVAPEEPERVADFMQRALEQLDHALTEAPDMSLRELDVLPEPERSLIQSWQEGPRIEVPDLCVHQLFEQQVERTPEATALVFEDQELSYAGLNARANQLAHHLIDLGVGPEVIVAVCLERSVELIVSLLAILKAGGAYLPLDPSWPKDRHALLLKEASCSVLINQDGVTILDVIAPLGKPASGSPLAYVTYTSGSTGKPKGVAISHHSIVRLVDPVNGFLLSAGHRVLQLAPVAFDAATFEIWGPLLNGGTLVMAPPEQPTLPALAALLKNHSITTLWLTAGLFHAMVEAELPALAGVQQILAGGDVLSGEHVQRLLDAFPPGHELINGYGPTENTTFTCCQHFEAAATVAPNGVAIGRPIANTEVRVLDEGGQPCPIGIPGELHIGGDGLARGYLNNPELTAEKFIPDPFSIDPSARLYKSGDLASWNPDGTLAFHGRIDQQIKLRGFRIEPGEIEAHLLAHPAVAQAVVLLRQDDPNNPRLIAYWVPDASQPSLASTGSEQLRAFLTDRLPDYMVPAAFLQLQALPLTPNGKLDRKALPTPSFSGNLEQRVAPSTDLERQLHTIWAEVLGHSDFGITDNFFAIGGHSLAAARLVSRIEHAIGFAPTLAALFQNPSIAGLAPLLSDSSAAAEENKSAKEAHQATPSENEACQIGRSKQFFADSEIDAIYPLNYIQKGFLIQSRLNKAHDPYLNIKYFTFNSAENYKKFIQACKVIAERHPLLRARFAWEELPEPAQIILKTPLEVNEISAELLSNVDIGTKLFELIPKALDLRKTPPFQIYTLNAESTERWAAAMLIHHIAYDMPSRRIIENEIRMIMAGQQQKLPEPACPSRLLQSSDAVAATSRDFFATMLQGAKPTLVPLSSESKPNKHIIAEQAQSSLDHTDVQDLFFCASLIGASSSSVILHAYSKVISRLTKSNDIILGIVIDQRSFSGFSEQSLVGPFITILPLRVPAASNSAADSANSINSTLGNLITHNTLPIKEIKKSAGLSLAEPMFNSIINIRRSESPPDPNMKQLFQGHQVDNRKNMQLSRNFPYYFLVNISEHLQSVNLSVRLPSDSQRAQEIATEFKQELEKTIKTIVLEKAPSKAGKMQD